MRGQVNRRLPMAFVVVLAFLIHDGMMATHVHSAEPGRHHPHHVWHVADQMAGTPDQPPPASHQPGRCGTVRPAVEPTGPDAAASPAASFLPVETPTLRGVVAPVPWTVPTAPPGVRRALLQVYRV